MADLRMTEYRRKFDKRVTIVVGQGGTVEADIALGAIRFGVRALILKAYAVIGADIAAASATVDKVAIGLFDRGAAGAGSTQVGSDVDNTASLADDIVHDFKADGYILAEDSVIGIEQNWTEAATPGAIVLTSPTIIVEWIPFPAV